MVGMFRRRPRRGGKKGGDASKRPKIVDGQMYWVSQGSLVFGSDARVPRRSRPVALVFHYEGFGYVLPATTKERASFFYLRAQDCPAAHGKKRLRDGYLSPYVEALKVDSLGNSICSLTKDCWRQLMDWVREQRRDHRGPSKRARKAPAGREG